MSVVKAKKVSASTELIYGQAAKQIAKAVADLSAVTTMIKDIEANGEELTLKIANQEDALASLVAEKTQKAADLDLVYAEKERQLKLDLELRMKANSEAVVLDYVRGKQSVVVPTAEYTGLKNDLVKLQESMDSTIKGEVSKAVAIVKAQHESDLKLTNAEYKAKEAENLSQIKVLSEKVSFLESTITKMYQQIDAERVASIERAKSSAIGTVSIGNQTGK